MTTHSSYDQQDDGLSSAVLSKGPCPKCGADDNLVTYQDGHAFCFTPGCGYHIKSSFGQEQHKVLPKVPQEHTGLIVTGVGFNLAYRGLKPDTLKRFEYTRSVFGKDKQQVDVWPIYDQAGDLAAQRLRFTRLKDFMVLKASDTAQGVNECQMFGRTVWGEKNDKRVIITEGEIDAMSVAQCTSFKYPCVSGNGGAGSVAKAIKANYKWLDRFDEVILWLDDDEAGRTATEECVRLFAIGKVKIAKMAGFKDANEALQASKFAEIELAVYAAQAWSPRGIVNARECWSDLEEDQLPVMWQYPYQTLQALTLGLRRSEVSYHVAGTGIGKTTSIIECLVHFLDITAPHTEGPAKIGYLGFEALRKEVMLAFLSVVARKRLNLEPIPKADLKKLHEALFGTGRVELFDPENAEWTFDAVMSYLRYMARALDCNILVLDPLSFLVAMLPGETDERRALDKVSQSLAALAKELNIHIAVCHHLTRPSEGPGHEEGGKVSLKQVRGSGGVANFASLVIGYERNQQAETEEAKTITTMRLLKNRFTGQTGLAGHTQYDMVTGKTYEISEAEATKLSGGKPSSSAPSEFKDWEASNTDSEF